jgi:ferrous iron transport protein B
MAEKIRKIALLGNPNAGKSSLFNQLTGMRQKVGNFPGVTVERKSGIIKLENKQEVEIIDLPGTYSLYPTSMDERIAVNALIDSSNKDYPDAIIYIIDITQLERHLLLLTQIMDLGFPIIVALNMNDIAATQNLQCDEQKLAALLGIDIVKVNGRTGEGISKIKSKLSILGTINSIQKYNASFYSLTDKEQKIAEEVKLSFKVRNNYHALLLLQQHKKSSFLSSAEKSILTNLVQQYQFNLLDHQLEEIMQRYNRFTPVVAKTLSRTITEAKTLTDKVDTIITHKVFGPIIFFTLMLFIFQAIFSWSSIPMDWIDGEFAQLATYFQAILPHNLFTRLLTEGLIPGISGVMVFVPQITILFLLITILEEVGYMSRVVFMFDNIMQRFGLNGRSIVALISGGACAVPAIMSTRTISNYKERLITIMVTPLISCSARIPVFAVLIGFVVPEIKIGIFNARGLVFMALYLIGILAALIASYVFKLILKSDEYSFLMLELPEYRKPHWRNVFHTLYVKVSSFVFGVGKIILLVSLVLWFLASFGPSNTMQQAEQNARTEAISLKLDTENTTLLIASKKLEASYAGIAGRWIEPAIRPLGFDWKIGIALITSFAAREVFVGTISTLYSIGKDADNLTIKQKMQQEKNADGQPVFTMAVALSLVLFYLFAMQCISTLAAVHRETKSYKWPIIQFAYMTGTAYIMSFIAYHIFR